MDLSFIVIFGTRWHFKAVRGGWSGFLDCPSCERSQRFEEQEAFKAFTVYWFPLFRTEDGGRLVECSICRGKFERPPENFGDPVGPQFSQDAASFGS